MELHGAETNFHWGNPSCSRREVSAERLPHRVKDTATRKTSLRMRSDGKMEQVYPSDCVRFPQLVQQLLRNCSRQSLNTLRNVEKSLDEKKYLPSTRSPDPGLLFLLQFQRLLLTRTYDEKEEFNPTAALVLSEYVAWLCGHATEHVELAIQLLEHQRNPCAIVAVLRASVVGKTDVLHH